MSIEELAEGDDDSVDVSSIDTMMLSTLRRGDAGTTGPEQVQLDAPAVRSAHGRYTFERGLGRGGMGEVTLCFDQVLRRRVARKSLRKNRGAEPQSVARFVREVLVQGQLEHPSIVPVYDLDFDDNGAPLFTMKRVRGRTLRDVLRARRAKDEATLTDFPLRKLLHAFDTVCQALWFAHSRGVIHRDLKPENIMLGTYGEVYVLDWGVAKIQNVPDLPPEESIPRIEELAGTEAGTMLGTPGYMAPEQIRGELDGTDERADVYALGAILFEILAGQSLHSGDAEARIKSTLEGAEARPSKRAPDRDVAPELEEICVRATAQDRDGRFGSVKDLHTAVERYLSDDRNIELRRELAVVHAENAKEAADRALREVSPEARRTGWQELGRALALDPSNAGAMETMARLLTAPPVETPKEVEQQIEAETGRRIHEITKIGSIGYGTFVGYIPLLLWMGVRSGGVLAMLYLFIGAFIVGSIYVLRTRRPVTPHVLMLLVLSNLVVGATSAVFGPLVLVPGFAAANITAFMLVLNRHRAFALVVATLPVAFPALLELVGAVSPAYSFSSHGMTVLPRMVDLPARPTLAFLAISGIGTIISSALIIGRVQQALMAAERRVFLNAWQLQQMVSPVR